MAVSINFESYFGVLIFLYLTILGPRSHMMDSTATVRADMGFYKGLMFWALLESSYGVHVF